MPTILRNDLEHMRKAAAAAVAILGNATLRQLEQNTEKQAALCFMAITIGEMAVRISKRYEDENYPGIDWARLAGMRNRIAHQPENVDLLIVFDTVAVQYPALISAIDAILQDLT